MPEFNISESVQKRVDDSLLRDSIKIILLWSLEDHCMSWERHLACLNALKTILAPSPYNRVQFLLTIFRLDLINNSLASYGFSESTKQYPWESHNNNKNNNVNKNLSGSISPQRHDTQNAARLLRHGCSSCFTTRAQKHPESKSRGRGGRCLQRKAKHTLSNLLASICLSSCCLQSAGILPQLSSPFTGVGLVFTSLLSAGLSP